MGDPREFFISCVNEHFPEFQLEFGFAVSSKGKKFCYNDKNVTLIFVCFDISQPVNLSTFCDLKICIWNCSYMYPM